jgi:hypothetical protein
VEDAHKPWWDGNSELDAARDEVLAWLRSAEDAPMPPDGPDPVWVDFVSGAGRRELAEARDDLGRARLRYEEAVRNVRAAGWSWGEIARVLGVSRQVLNHRFRDEVG